MKVLVFAVLLLLVTLVYSQRNPEDEEKPDPYSFSFSETDEFGTQLTRQEQGDANGNVKGSYSYRDPAGIYRTVEYSSDDHGINSQIKTNEPGVISHKTAGADYVKSN